MTLEEKMSTVGYGPKTKINGIVLTPQCPLRVKEVKSVKIMIIFELPNICFVY